MTRFDDWPQSLNMHIKAASGRPFSWGSFDCCTFACDGIAAMTGVDPMADLRGRYSTAASSARCLRAFAGGGLMEAAEKITGSLGMPAIDTMMAGRGDCVLAEVFAPGNLRAPALGLVSMNGREAAFASISGVLFIPMRQCLRAWKV